MPSPALLGRNRRRSSRRSPRNGATSIAPSPTFHRATPPCLRGPETSQRRSVARTTAREADPPGRSCLIVTVAAPLVESGPCDSKPLGFRHLEKITCNPPPSMQYGVGEQIGTGRGTTMASENHGAVVLGIERIFNEGSLTGLSGGQLLRQFASGDQAAFEALVRWHGPLVLSVCRRLLDDPRDVDDAFQATFLVLLKKAGALRDAEGVSPWLHGVAHRVAARIRSRSARRPAEESKGARPEAVELACDLERSELRTLIDEEIGRLPRSIAGRWCSATSRAGRTRRPARRLRCTAGSLRGRLDRAREKLKDRLTRRGMAPAVGLAALAAAARRIRGVGPGPARRRDGRDPGPRRDGHGGLGYRVGVGASSWPTACSGRWSWRSSGWRRPSASPRRSCWPLAWPRSRRSPARSPGRPRSACAGRVAIRRRC